MPHPLLEAIETNDLEGFKKTLQSTLAEEGGATALQALCNDEGLSPSTLAASLGRVHMVKAMVDAGLDMGLEDRRSMTPLHEAAANGHADVVEALLKDRWLDREAKNALGETAVHLAAEQGQVGALRMLGEKGANMTAPGPLGNDSTHYAARGGHAPALRELHDRWHASLMERNRNRNGDTPAHLAVAANKPDAIREIGRLQGAKALVLQDKDGNQPIHVAASVGFHEAVRALAESRVPLDLPNKGGLTPAKAAAMPLDPQMAAMGQAPMWEEKGNPARVLDVLREQGVDVPKRPDAKPVEDARPQWQRLLGEVGMAAAPTLARDVKAPVSAPGGAAP